MCRHRTCCLLGECCGSGVIGAGPAYYSGVMGTGPEHCARALGLLLTKCLRLLLTKSYNTVLTIIIVPLTLFPLYLLLLVRLHCEIVCLPFLQTHRETDHFLSASGVHLTQTNFHCHHAAFSSQLKSKVGNILDKAAALRINLNIDEAPISSRSHTHPSHIQNSRLLSSFIKDWDKKKWCACAAGIYRTSGYPHRDRTRVEVLLAAQRCSLVWRGEIY